MSLIREGTAFTRSTVALVLTTFLALILSPTAAAARLAARDPSPLLGKSASVAVEADKLNDALKQVKATLGRIDALLRKGAVPAVELKALVSLRADLVAADKDVIAAFARDLEHIKKRNLPAVIEQRHAKAMADYQGRQARMLGYLDALAALKNPTALKAKVKEAGDWLAKQQFEPAPAPFDPNKLGFQVETKKARAPKLTSKELKALFPAKVPVNTSANEWSEPLMVASAGSMAGLIAASAIAPPGAEYLAPTIDVQITPEIQALAAQLHHRPVEIHNWVRNNIEWIPTYGSVQGSALTLDKKTGNAFDTSSLLIALLRASGIPARYVYGTIQVPIAQAMNWAGGFTHPDAAQTFLATGGIPNNALTSGGVTKYIRLEHVWVEAFVDFYPSRGAKNLAPDTWAPMDASFKQYAYTDGLDLQVGVPFDAQDFLTAAQDGATVNEQEGWVQNLNQANIQTKLTQYQQQLQSFIESQNPDATVGEVLGAKTIQPSNAPVLAASLPYQLIAVGNRYSALPDSLRHKFQYSLYANAYERSIENPLWTYMESTPNLAGKKITLSFVPASDTDRQTIESYLPKPHEDGSPIQPEEFPSSLPAYNIRVTAELRVEGSVVATGGTFTLGTELVGEGGFTRLYNVGDWDLTQERHVAGQASALGISLQGISPKTLSGLKDRLISTKAKLERNDFSGVTGEHLSGDLFTGVTWSYFYAIELIGRMSQQSLAIVISNESQPI